MKDTKVATRYAKSLLELSIELKSLEVVLADMKLINSVGNANAELVTVLRSPIIKSDKKLKILTEIFGCHISPITQKLLQLLSSKSREAYIVDISEQFVNQYKTHKGITTAVISSAVALDDVSRKRVLDLVKASANSDVELEEQTRADLIGGFVLRIGDTQVDASVLRQIKNLKRNFSENPYVKEF